MASFQIIKVEEDDLLKRILDILLKTNEVYSNYGVIANPDHPKGLNPGEWIGDVRDLIMEARDKGLLPPEVRK